MKSKVYFTDFHTTNSVSLIDKFTKLIEASGMADSIDFRNKFTVIKLHFGELGNLAFLRPNFARALADYIKRKGGRVFLSDCNTLYTGSRSDALSHLECAEQNGYTPLTTGCEVIIADGLKGTDDIEVPVKNGEFLKTARIGRAIMDADIFISLTHFKGHESTGFGGTLKNIGMGCGSRLGKMDMHNSGKPFVNTSCVGCGTCSTWCAHSAPVVKDGKCNIDQTKCVGCGRCILECPVGAISQESSSNTLLSCKIAEYTQAVLNGRPSFHFSIINQVSPFCDCYGSNDVPILPDIGMFASADPVALDQACVDACLNAPIQKDSLLFHAPHTHGGDHFKDLHPDSEWKAGLAHAEKLGLGSTSYDLFTIQP